MAEIFLPFYTNFWGIARGRVGLPYSPVSDGAGITEEGSGAGFPGFRALEVKCFNHISLDSAPKFLEFPEFLLFFYSTF